jgi:hypothetical protein
MIATNQEAVYRSPLEQHHETDQRMQRKASAFGVLLIRYEWRVKIIHLHSSVNLFSSVTAFSPLYLFLLYKVTLFGNLEMFRCDVTSREFPIHLSDGKCNLS